jgi:hypothetical protein
MEDDLNIVCNGRRPQFFFKRKTTSKKIIIFKNGRGLIVFKGRQPKKLKMRDDLMQPKTIKSKNNGCGTTLDNLVLPFSQKQQVYV